MGKDQSRRARWGRVVLCCGCFLLFLGLVMLFFVDPVYALWVLLVSILLNAAGGYLLVFGKKKE